MRLIYYKEISSTQKFLIEKIKKGDLSPPICVWSDYQTDGIGSRGRNWIGKRGNLFFSFSYELNSFSDIPIQSLSIYFGWIFKKALNELGSEAVLKWPNDIYLISNDSAYKIGGVLTNIAGKFLVCGIGLNTLFAPCEEFGCLDIKVKNDKILNKFFSLLGKKLFWSDVIEEYKMEFEKYKNYFGYDNAVLLEDGSIQLNKKRMYSKR